MSKMSPHLALAIGIDHNRAHSNITFSRLGESSAGSQFRAGVTQIRIIKDENYYPTNKMRIPVSIDFKCLSVSSFL